MSKKKNNNLLIIGGLGIGGLFLIKSGAFDNLGGNTAPAPNEAWFLVPDIGPTPQSQLPQLGYVYFTGYGWYHQTTLNDNGWTVDSRGQWLPPQRWGAAEWLNLSGQVLNLASSVIPSGD